MFNPVYKIIIGTFIFTHAASVKVEHSRNNIVDTATITLPLKYDREKVYKKLSTGMKVEIWLGYAEDEMRKEFTGFVSEIKPGIPVVIVCENQMYSLKRSSPESKSWKSVTLKEVLQYLVPDATIEVPEINITKFTVYKTATILKALEKIKETYGLDIYYRADTLNVGLAYVDKDVLNKTVIFHLQKNVVSDNLIYRKAEDVKIKLKMISYKSDNTIVEYETGDEDGELRSWHEYNLSKAELKAIADERIKKFKFDGLSGSLTAMGIPYCEHGWVADIRDADELKQGRYFIDTTITTSGTEGFRREVFLGKKAE